MIVTAAEIIKTINHFRQSVPVDVEGLAKALGIHVRYSDLGTEISGMIEKNDDGNGYVITVNQDDSETRQRFTIAHELGHFVLHRDKIGNGIEDSRIYRSMNEGKYKNLNIGKYEETQANQFAATLLMPVESIKKIQESGYNDIAKIADILKVSQKALEIRMRSIG